MRAANDNESEKEVSEKDKHVHHFLDNHVKQMDGASITHVDAYERFLNMCDKKGIRNRHDYQGFHKVVRKHHESARIAGRLRYTNTHVDLDLKSNL